MSHLTPASTTFSFRCHPWLGSLKTPDVLTFALMLLTYAITLMGCQSAPPGKSNGACTPKLCPSGQQCSSTIDSCGQTLTCGAGLPSCSADQQRQTDTCVADQDNYLNNCKCGYKLIESCGKTIYCKNTCASATGTECSQDTKTGAASCVPKTTSGGGGGGGTQCQPFKGCNTIDNGTRDCGYEVELCNGAEGIVPSRVEKGDGGLMMSVMV